MSNERPPDLDELLKNLFGKINNLKKPQNPNESGSNDNDGYNSSLQVGNSKNIVYLVLGLVFALWVVLGFYVINEKERAVVLRLGKFTSVLEPGLHWRPYVLDRVAKVNTTSVRTINTSGVMLTKDENIIRANVGVQYVVSDPRSYLLDVKDPEIILANALDSALRHEVGNSDMNSVLTTGRNLLATNVDIRLKDYMKLYSSGIEIVKVNIESTQAPGEVQEAFDDVIKAREDEARFINQAIAYSNEILPKARGAAERIRKEAEAYSQSVESIATGEASRFSNLVAEYQKNPTLVRQRLYQETIERIMSNTTKVVVDKNSGQQLMFLPLADILKMDNKTLSNQINPQDLASKPQEAIGGQTNEKNKNLR